MSINRRRLLALCRKESLQIVRDPSSILIAFIMPVVLLVVMGYAINLDVDHLRLGIWRTDGGAPAIRLEQALRGSNALEVHGGPSKEALLGSLERGEIRGLLVIDEGFSRAMAGQGGGTPRVLLLTDGSEPNTANFVTNYVQGIWQGWLAREGFSLPVAVEITYPLCRAAPTLVMPSAGRKFSSALVQARPSASTTKNGSAASAPGFW